MIILQQLKKACLDNIHAYNQHFQVNNSHMPPQRALDIITIKQLISQATLASALKQDIENHIKQMQKIGFFERLFNTHFCLLVKLLSATLKRPEFQMMPMLITETQQLYRSNITYQQQLADLGQILAKDLIWN